MKFKLIKEPNEELFNLFRSFCLKSKPLDFCELPSMQMRLIKIKQYFNNIFFEKDCVIGLENDEIVGFFCIKKRNEIAGIVIAFGLHPKITFNKISKMFTDFRKFYKQENPEIKSFVGEVVRNYKKDSYLKFLKKYVKPSRIDLDKDPIMVYFDD
jgi:hypothetical protein